MAFFKDFLTKQLLKRQLKGMSADQQEKITALVQKDPAFFKVIGDQIQEEIKKGKGQMEATMFVMKQHKEKMAELMQGIDLK